MKFNTLYKEHAESIFENEKTGVPASRKHMKEVLSRLDEFSIFEGYGDRDIEDFKPLDIKAWINSLKIPGVKRKRGLAVSSQNRYVAAVSRVFTYAIEYEIMTKASPVLSSMWKEESNTRQLYYDEVTRDRLIAFFRQSDCPWIADMAVISVNTGMRLGEILMLDRGEAKVLTDSSGKRYIWLPKTKNGDSRVVWLNSKTEAAVEALAAIPGYWRQHKFYDLWDEARHKIYNHKDCCFHLFRHTAATIMANDLNINTTLIGKMLGHRSEGTTKKYIHETPAKAQAVAAMMNVG